MLIDHDLDLDLHAIWYESSGIPTPPPCLVMPVREMYILEACSWEVRLVTTSQNTWDLEMLLANW
jgi:hypothetical protein